MVKNRFVKWFCKGECEKDTPRYGCQMACKMNNFAKALERLQTVGQDVGYAFQILRALENADNEKSVPTKNEDDTDFTSEIHDNSVIVSVINNINVSVPLFSNN